MIKSRLVRPAGFIEPCIPVLETKPPIGEQWVHQIKYDGYRLQVHRDGERVRIFTRRGFDWTDRFPVIASTALTLKAGRFVLDGEGVVTDAAGVTVFDQLYGHRRYTTAFLQAFDLLSLNGEVLRRLPLFERKAMLAELLADTDAGIVNDGFQSLRRGRAGQGVSARTRRHRIEEDRRAVPIRPIGRLDQSAQSRWSRGEAICG